jgi:hypothetical protein
VLPGRLARGTTWPDGGARERPSSTGGPSRPGDRAGDPLDARDATSASTSWRCSNPCRRGEQTQLLVGGRWRGVGGQRSHAVGSGDACDFTDCCANDQRALAGRVMRIWRVRSPQSTVSHLPSRRVWPGAPPGLHAWSPRGACEGGLRTRILRWCAPKTHPHARG